MAEALVWPQRRHYKNHRKVFGIDPKTLAAKVLCIIRLRGSAHRSAAVFNCLGKTRRFFGARAETELR
jgi:hypothetical protein